MRSILRTILQYMFSRPRYTYYVRYSGAYEYRMRTWIRIIAFVLIFGSVLALCSWFSANVFPLGSLVGYNGNLEFVLTVLLAIVSWLISRLIP